MTEREKLLQLRNKIAKASGQSTYLVPNDKEIEMLLKVRPKTLEELSAIKGFPKNGKRVAAYGNELISIFNEKKTNGATTNPSGLKGTSIFG